MKRLVHAVLRVGDNEGRELVLPAGLRCLVSGDLAIAFCAVAVEELTPTVPRLEAFARTVAELHRNHTTIPFRFGCTVESDSQLVAWIENELHFRYAKIMPSLFMVKLPPFTLPVVVPAPFQRILRSVPDMV